MYKVIFIDIDGTLKDSNGYFLKELRKRINLKNKSSEKGER